MTPSLHFDKFDSDRCYRNWKASCGPHSIAAAFGFSLDAIRPHMPHLKGWMSPTNVEAVLQALGVSFSKTLVHRDNHKMLRHGVNRLQMEGDWLAPDKPRKLAYFHTHYIAVAEDEKFVLDPAIDPSQWISVAQWFSRGPTYTFEPPNRGWHITHWYQPSK